MAIPAGAVWEIRATATAANANGGGFNPANANFPTDLAATSGTGNSPVVSSASYNFVAGDVGHWIYIKSGTNWTPGWYQIASVAANAATLSAAIGQAIQQDTTRGNPSPKFSLNTVAGCATVASPSSGTWGLDYSQADSVAFTAADLVLATTTTCTSASKPFGVNHVGNMIHIRAGTNFTQAWYEIVSVAVTTATVDRAAGTAGSTSGTFSVGGALSLGSSTANQTDASVFGSTNCADGNRYFVKAGSYTIGTAPTIQDAVTGLPVTLEGYSAARGDAPTGTSRPVLDCGSGVFGLGNVTSLYHLRFTGTGNIVVSSASSQVYHYNCQAINTSTTAARPAFGATSTGNYYELCEGVSYRGPAFSLNSTNHLRSCWAHDSNIGVILGTTSVIEECLVENCVTAALQATSPTGCIVRGNTLIGAYGASCVPTGVGFSILTAGFGIVFENNIIAGFATGVSHAVALPYGNLTDYNIYFNNTTPRTNWFLGAHDQTIDPGFLNEGQVNGTTAVTLSGNRLQDSAKNFTTLGVVVGDFLYVVSGTGPTAGIYKITAITTVTNPNDTLTVDLTLTANATANKVYQIGIGHNPTIGSAIRAAGSPGLFPGGVFSLYTDPGVGQHQDSPIPVITQTINQYVNGEDFI